MSLPTFLNPPASPIEIDPGVEYKYVAPAQNYTILNFRVQLGFSLSLSGRTLTVKYINPTPAIDTDYEIEVTAQNSEGLAVHTIPFRVKATLIRRLDLSFFAACINGSQNLRYGTDDTNPNSAKPINARLAVGTKIKAVTRSNGDDAVTGIEVATLFVVAVNDAAGTFKVSAISGGAPITPDHDATYYFEIAFAINGSPLIYVGDNTSYNNNVFLLNEPVTFAASDGAALPAAFTGGPFYIKEKVGPYYVKVSAAVGGAAINSGADSFLTDHDVELIADFSGGRAFPAITSASELTMATADAVDYTITADVAPDSWGAANLPAGLALNTATGHITGNLSGTILSFYAVILIAYRGSNASYRYWLINVTDAPTTTDVLAAPDLIYDVSAKRFYQTNENTVSVVIGDPSLVFGLEQDGETFELPPGTIVRFGLKPKDDFDSGIYLVYGSDVLAAADSKFSCGENWNTPELLALVTDQKHVDFTGQFEWKPPGATSFTKSLPLIVRVWNNIFREDTVPGADPIIFPYFYWGFITRLTGGVLATDLDAQPIAGLPPKTLIKIVISGRGASEWRKEQDATSPATDVDDAGRIVPPDYNAVSMPYVLKRVSGF